MSSSAPPGGSSLSKIHDFFRGDKDKISPSLKRALIALQLDNLEGLEEQFLATEAFLRPWSQFRDALFLQQPDALPQATVVACDAVEDGITRMELLWFYTQFDEGLLRYDPRADESAKEYTCDNSVHGIINKGRWCFREHEKLLYTWLLQEFKVGKKTNPWGFAYFQLQSVTTAWDTVLVPIVDAVRASYNVKGRRHYGRLALFIESRCPSGLAFPQNNVNVVEGGMSSPTPFRLLSMPKKVINNRGTTYNHHMTGQPVLTKKHYDETERELRDVYPQYGGLVERPRFKHKMEEWLIEQRMRAERRKVAGLPEEISGSQLQALQQNGSRGTPDSKHKRQSSEDSSLSPIKRYSDQLRRSLSLRFPKKALKEEPKSPLHGVTRQLVFPDRNMDMSSTPVQQSLDPRRIENSAHRSISAEKVVAGSIEQPGYHSREEDSKASSIKKNIVPTARPDASRRKDSEYSVYNKIRNSNSFDESFPELLKTRRSLDSMGGKAFSPMDPMSTIPPPLPYDREHGHTEIKQEKKSAGMRKKSYAETRIPSYEGNGYSNEVSLSALQEGHKSAARTLGPAHLAKPPTRLPTPIRVTPYAGQLRVASKETAAMPKAVPWPGSSLPRPVACPGRASPTSPAETVWPRCEPEGPRPPVPPRSLERRNPSHGYEEESRLQQLGRDNPQDMSRIVSKENIRAALGNISVNSSVESLPLPKAPFVEAAPKRTMSPAGGLQAFNKNMFPRKVTPGGSAGKGDKGRK